MAAKRDVDWQAIRREWETTDVSDAALAARWGFRSPNSIARRRHDEAWDRNLEEVGAALVVKAVAHVGKRREAAPTSHARVRERTTAPHTTTQQSRASEGRAKAPVGAKTAKSAPSAPAPDWLADIDAPTPAKSRGDLRDTPDAASAAAEDERPLDPRCSTSVVPAPRTIGTMQELADIRVQAISEQLTTGREMVATGLELTRLVHDVATGGRGRANPFFAAEQARKRLGGVSDKDTIAGIMKSAAAMIAEGTKIQRDALGMNVAAQPKAEEAAGPVGIRVEDIMPLFGFGVLEKAALAAGRATTIRPVARIVDVERPRSQANDEPEPRRKKS